MKVQQVIRHINRIRLRLAADVPGGGWGSYARWLKGLCGGGLSSHVGPVGCVARSGRFEVTSYLPINVGGHLELITIIKSELNYFDFAGNAAHAGLARVQEKERTAVEM